MEQERAIIIENLSFLLANDEREEITKRLNEQQIEMIFYEKRSTPIASLFDAINIYFSEPLTVAITSGLLSSAAYDAIK